MSEVATQVKLTEFCSNLIDLVGNMALSFMRGEEIDVVEAINMLLAMKEMNRSMRRTSRVQQKGRSAEEADDLVEVQYNKDDLTHRAIQEFAEK